MYVIRTVIVLLLILAVVAAYNPRVRTEIAEAWETIQPAVVELMDSFYAALRDLITYDIDDQGDDAPAPRINFERIVTMNNIFLF